MPSNSIDEKTLRRNKQIFFITFGDKLSPPNSLAISIENAKSVLDGFSKAAKLSKQYCGLHIEDPPPINKFLDDLIKRKIGQLKEQFKKGI